MVATGSEALANLSEFDPDLIVINATSLHSSGKRISRALKADAQKVPILVILMINKLPATDPSADVVFKLPFTSRKLLNRIRRLLPGEAVRFFTKDQSVWISSTAGYIVMDEKLR